MEPAMSDEELREYDAERALHHQEVQAWERAQEQIAVLTAQRDEANSAAELAEGTVAALRDRLAELEAIIAGRTTPPTDAEIKAHRARGGLWRVRDVGGQITALCGDALGWEAATWLLTSHLPGHNYRWWPLDTEGRPTAWPTAEVPRG